MGVQTGEDRLKRQIGFFSLLAMSVGLNIGGALFALTSLAAAQTGPALPLAMLVSGVPALLAVIPYGVLTSAMPTTSATYRYAQLVNPTLALVTLLTLAVCICIGGQPLYALAFGKYLGELGWFKVNPILAGAIMLTFFYLINLLGVRLTARIQTVLFVLLMVALVLYIVLGAPHVDWKNFSPFLAKGPVGVLVGAGLLFTFCAGGFFVIDLGGEVVMANRIFPRVLLLGMVLVIILYLLILSVTVGVVPWTALKGKSLVAVARNFMGRGALAFFIIGGALFACATTVNIIFSIMARGLMVVAGEGMLPAWLGRVNARFGTPHWGLTVAYVISLAALIAIPSLMFFGSMLNLGLVGAVTLVAVAGLVLPRKYPGLYAQSSFKVPRPLARAAAGAVVVINVGIFAFFCLAIKWASLVFAAVAVAFWLYSLAHRPKLQEVKARLRRMHAGYFEGDQSS